MNGSLGNVLVLAGLGFAAFGAVVGLVTGLLRRESALPWVQRAVYGFAASMILSNAVMIKALLEHDFSLKYVASVGSRATPTIFTIVSLWSALEGSILFWGAIMGVYLFAFTWTYRKEHGRYMQLSLGRDERGGRLLRLPHRRARQPVDAHLPNPLDGRAGAQPAAAEPHRS